MVNVLKEGVSGLLEIAGGPQGGATVPRWKHCSALTVPLEMVVEEFENETSSIS